MLRGVVVVAALMTALAVASPAGAATPAQIELGKVTAQRAVKDVILDARSPATAASRTPARARAAFADAGGRQFMIDTTVAGYDLAQPAGVLTTTYHGDEISKLAVHVVTLAEMAALCGDPEAVACYRPAPGGYGQLWFAADDSDWVHSLVHEYGHHMDNQFGNLSVLSALGGSGGCTIDADGTRDWFFVRLDTQKLAQSFACRGVSWDYLVAELYAEDFVALNGISGWQLQTAPPPTADQLGAMKYDIDQALFTSSKKYSKRIRIHRSWTISVATPNFSFLRVKVNGPRGSDFDVYVYPKGQKRYWSKSTKRGRVEDYVDLVLPGSWRVIVTSRKKTARAKIAVRLF